jgi:hypothetical protein
MRRLNRFDLYRSFERAQQFDDVRIRLCSIQQSMCQKSMGKISMIRTAQQQQRTCATSARVKTFGAASRTGTYGS